MQASSGSARFRYTYGYTYVHTRTHRQLTAISVHVLRVNENPIFATVWHKIFKVQNFVICCKQRNYEEGKKLNALPLHCSTHC